LIAAIIRPSREYHFFTIIRVEDQWYKLDDYHTPLSEAEVNNYLQFAEIVGYVRTRPAGSHQKASSDHKVKKEDED
jgi:hypothetical protein